MFQHGTGVPTDYAKALHWFYKAAAQGNADAENQLGWMYQFGQGVQQDDDKALAWYRLSADQGNIHGKNNLQAFCDELEDGGDERCESGNASVPDAAIAQAQRRARMSDLRGRIDGLEADAQKQESEVNDLEHMSKAKKDAISKVMDAIGTTVAVSPGLQAQKDRAEAERLRDELARLENEDRVAASVSEP
jgi:hypothetical protein